MEKYAKSYVEIICNTMATRCEEVAERDPFAIKNDGFINGFRFFDISYIEDDGLIYESKKHNYSKNVYFGERLTVPEMLERFSRLTNFIDLGKPDATYCVFNSGDFIMLNDDDITYDELMEKKERQNKNIPRGIFF